MTLCSEVKIMAGKEVEKENLLKDSLKTQSLKKTNLQQ